MYTLTIDDKQAHTIVRALELYCRLSLGQYERLADLASRNDWSVAWDEENDRLIAALKSLHMGLALNQSLGIHSERSPKDAQMAFDLEQVIRRRLALDEGAKHPNVWLNEFMSASGHPFIARIEKAP